jgi:hypothetical protein
MGLHRLSHFKCSLTLTESGLPLLAGAVGSRLQLLQADCIKVAPADLHTGLGLLVAPPAAAAAQHHTGGGVAAAGAAGGSLVPGGAGGSGTFGQLGPQLPALRVLQLRRLGSSSPQLWQLAPNLTSLMVWGETNNAGLTRCVRLCAHTALLLARTACVCVCHSHVTCGVPPTPCPPCVLQGAQRPLHAAAARAEPGGHHGCRPGCRQPAEPAAGPHTV